MTQFDTLSHEELDNTAVATELQPFDPAMHEASEEAIAISAIACHKPGGCITPQHCGAIGRCTW